MSRANPDPPDTPIDSPEKFAEAFDVSRETLAALQVYEDLLRRWQRVKNLVAPDSLTNIWHRHFADSAQLLALAPDARVWLDLGTGAGFPGLVLAIMLESDSAAKVHLVEANGRKCAFLRDVARRTGAGVEIHNSRIESLGNERTLAGIDVVTARALAPLDRLMEYVGPYLLAGATGLFLKGRETGVAPTYPGATIRRHPSITDREAAIIEVVGSQTH